MTNVDGDQQSRRVFGFRLDIHDAYLAAARAMRACDLGNVEVSAAGEKDARETVIRASAIEYEMLRGIVQESAAQARAENRRRGTPAYNKVFVDTATVYAARLSRGELALPRSVTEKSHAVRRRTSAKNA